MRTRRLNSAPWSWVLLLGAASACDSGPGDGAATGSPSTTAIPDNCVASRVDEKGGTLNADGARLVVPQGALDGESVVQLCSSESSETSVVSPVWTIGPESTSFLGPVNLEIDHSGAEDGTQLFVPAAEGGARWAFGALRPSPGTMAGDTFRVGDHWVGVDPRQSEPYGAVQKGEVLVVLDGTGSMTSAQARLTSDMPQLANKLLASNVDFHLGITTMNMADPGNGNQGNLREIGGRRWVATQTNGLLDLWSEHVPDRCVGATRRSGGLPRPTPHSSRTPIWRTRDFFARTRMWRSS